jgi:hypothetical protein
MMRVAQLILCAVQLLSSEEARRLFVSVMSARVDAACFEDGVG